MNPRKDAVPDIALKILSSQPDYVRAPCRRRVRKQGDNGLGGKLHYGGGAQAKSNGDQDGIPQSLYGPFRLSGADVLRPQSRDSGKHGGGHKEEKADDLFHDSHRRRVV